MTSTLTKRPFLWTCFLVLPALSMSCEDFEGHSDAPSPAGLADIDGATSGLLATYFDNKDFTDKALERVDSVVDFDWGRGAPDSKVGSDSFSARWTGFVEAKHSETYTFYTVGDDGIRLYVGDELVVNDWSNHGPRERSGTIALEAGKLYSIKLEYYEDRGGAVARLLWSSPSQSKQVVPAEQLFTEEPADGPIITASGENSKYGEVKENAFDGDTKTKWLTFHDAAWIQYDFAGNSSKVVTQYSITSANDAQERDPKDWKLLGSNDGENFQAVDERSGERFTARFQTKTYAVQSPGSFKMYRLNISSNYDPPRASSTQLAEIELDEGEVADECPNDPNKTKPGECGCGIPEGTCGGAGDVTNVALGKPTVQSTTAYRGESSRAVDGNTSGRYGDDSITHTSYESSPWWQVDLGEAHRVERVVLFNRTDCCGDRLSDFHVDYLDEDKNIVATQKHDGAAGAETEIALAASGVHFVRIQLDGTNFLSLAEVRVFGVAGAGTGVDDLCPDDPNKTEPGICGCGVPEGTCDGDDVSAGLIRKYYRGRWSALPDFDMLIPNRVDIADTVVLGRYDNDEAFGLVFTGIIEIGAADRYDFELGSDDGSRLLIDGHVVVNNDGPHGFTPLAGSIDLTGGDHEIRVEYFDRGGGDDLRLRYRRSGGSLVEVPAGVFFHTGEIDYPDDPDPTEGPLDKADNTKLRIGSWNNHRGSIFPKTSSLWRAINTSGKYHVTRTEGAARVIQAVDADIWLMQETCYSSSGLPSGVSEDDVNRQIASYMRSVTGDSWDVRCNGRGLCTLIRGSIRFDGHWEKGTRVTGDRVILPDGSRALLMNTHYMNLGNAQDTRDIIEDVQSTVSAVFVGGDFNNGPGGDRYNTIDNISGMNNLSMYHWKDPFADHLTSAMQYGQHTNTKGYMKWGEGAAGEDLVTYIGGGHIDHFFLKSGTWRAGNRLILNTLLFAPETLDLYGLEPLDIALQPQYYLKYFEDFLTDGIIHEIPATAYDAGDKLDHDHLPMIVDFTW